MNRTECEAKLEQLFAEMVDTAKQYSPGTGFLSACFVEQHGNKFLSINNGYRDEESPDAEFPIDVIRIIKRKWSDLFVNRDPVTGTFDVLIDGETAYEHLAEDELGEVMRSLTN